ncbi:MAG: hypothetical protein ACD_43C00015G0002 [uncultured bacterium]|nr:MAG: hypothetical protein ACD_43C00015G0002 [uncultured bacterium]
MEKRLCPQCQQTFIVSDGDLSYYQRLQVPVPTKCPQCRFQLRMSFRNERFLYRRECALCHQSTLAQYSSDKPYPIYCRTCWWSDRWDPLSFGQEIDWTQPFFPQFSAVKARTPHIALLNDADSENSDFCNRVNKLKSCYMIYDAVGNEQCAYGSGLYGNKDSIDCDYCDRVELCYDTIYSSDCYGLRSARNCAHCRDSAYLVDCVGVSNSLMCVGLRNVQYHYKNKTLTQAEFDRVWKTQQPTQAEFEQFALKIPRRYYNGINNEASSGDFLTNTYHTEQSFQVRASEHCKYCYGVHHTKDSYDYTIWGDQAELMYEDHACGGQCYKIWFGNVVWYGHDTLYCDSCLNGAQYCFGCVGLKNEQYCILNRQYAPEEFSAIQERLIKHMRATKEWGNFFPADLSDFAYNETMAHEFFPLTKQQALVGGWGWQDQLPGTFGQADPAKNIFTCLQCQKNYKLIAQELDFYKQQGITLPINCPDCRHQNRMRYRSPYKLWPRQCMCQQANHNHGGQICTEQFETAYAPDRPELIYCSECFQKEVY